MVKAQNPISVTDVIRMDDKQRHPKMLSFPYIYVLIRKKTET